MSETLGDWLCSKLPVIVSPKPDKKGAAALAFTILESGGWLDAPIIRPTPDAKPYIVTREAGEAAGRQFWNATRLLRVDQLNDVEWDDLSPVRKLQLIEEGVAILTALGPFVVADAVLSVGDGDRMTISDPWIHDGAECIALALPVKPGDTIYIKRRESEEATSDE